MAVPVEAVADEPPPVGSSDSVEDTRVPGPETDMSQSTSLNELPPELLWSILGHLPSTASTAQLLCGVCKEWRDAILHEDKYLNNLQFTLDTNQPFRGLGNVKGAVARREIESQRRNFPKDDYKKSTGRCGGVNSHRQTVVGVESNKTAKTVRDPYRHTTRKPAKRNGSGAESV